MAADSRKSAKALLKGLGDGLTVTLRPEKPADLSFLCALYASTREMEVRLAGFDPGAMASFLQNQFQLQRQHYRAHFPHDGFFIVEKGGVAIGRFYVAPGKDDFRIVDISLVAPWRGAGIGTELIQTLQRHAAARKCSVSLHVMATNGQAFRLYAKLGFSLIDQSSPHWFMKWGL